jgi:hypothetical protein
MVLSAETMPAPGLASSVKAAILAELSKPTCNNVSIQFAQCTPDRNATVVVTNGRVPLTCFLKTGARVLVVNVRGYRRRA